jgi:hypothetical protein
VRWRYHNKYRRRRSETAADSAIARSSGLVHALFIHVLQRRPRNALHYGPVASDKLKVGSFLFLINVHDGQYSMVALSGNAVVLPWNA